MARLKMHGWGQLILSIMLLLADFISPAKSGQALLDEAKRAGREAPSFPQAGEDYFHDMDNGLPLTPDEIKGRNMWIVWTGGNDRLWDKFTGSSLGTFDLLKVVTSHPSQTYCYGKCDRDSRWHWLGAVNEPSGARSSSLKPARVAIQANCQSLLGRRSIREVALVLAISSAGNATGV